MRFLASLIALGALSLFAADARAQDAHEHTTTRAASKAATFEETLGHEDHGHSVPEGAPPTNWTDMRYADKDMHGGELEAGEEPMAPPLLLALLNFAIFAGLLYWKAGPALRKYLNNRHEAIRNALEEAAKLQEEAREKMAEYSSRIADADAEVTALIEQIRRDAEAERAKIVADAERQAERMQKDAEARIESEFATARRQLEAEIVARAAEVAERLVIEKSSVADHQNLFSGFITDLKTGTGAQDAPEKGPA